MMAVIHIHQDNFNEEVLESDVPVLLDFWAPWCGPCKALSPIVDKLSKKVGNQIKIGKVNVDEESELTAQFNIMSIPTLIVIKNGEVSSNAIGMLSPDNIMKMLED